MTEIPVITVKKKKNSIFIPYTYDSINSTLEEKKKNEKCILSEEKGKKGKLVRMTPIIEN